jgi:hypothetical protein
LFDDLLIKHRTLVALAYRETRMPPRNRKDGGVARTEARIFTSIWRDPDFLALEPGAQRLYMFLLSQDDLSYCGVMPLRPVRWARKAAGLTLADIDRDLKTLEGTAYPSANPSANPDPESARTPLVIADRDTGELLVRSLMRRDEIWRQPNLLKKAREEASHAESPRICGAILAELRRLPLEETPSVQVRTLVAEFITELEKGSPYPSAYPSAYPSPDPADNPEPNPKAKDHARAQGSGGKVATEGESPESQIPVPQEQPPPYIPPPSPRTGTRLPGDFALTGDMLAWAAEHAPHVDAQRELARFGDYWRSKPGKDGRKLDWLATWRNWMRTAEDRQGPRERPPPSRPSTGDRALAEAAELKAQLRHPRELT